MIPRDVTPPCRGDHELFDSRNPYAHEIAKAICLDCPVLVQCRGELESAQADGLLIEGTWAAQGFGIARWARPACGTNGGWVEHRRRQEEVCGPCASARWEHEERLRLQKEASAQRLRESGPPAKWAAKAATHAAEHFGVSIEAVFSDRRSRPISAARRVAAAAASSLGDTQSAIGRSLGRNHTSIAHALQTITDDERLVAAQIAARLSSRSAA